MIATAKSSMAEVDVIDLGSAPMVRELEQLRRDKAEQARQLNGQRQLIARLQSRPSDWEHWRDVELSSWIMDKAVRNGRQIAYSVDADCDTEEFIPCSAWVVQHDGGQYEIELLRVDKRADGRLATIYTVTRIE